MRGSLPWLVLSAALHVMAGLALLRSPAHSTRAAVDKPLEFELIELLTAPPAQAVQAEPVTEPQSDRNPVPSARAGARALARGRRDGPPEAPSAPSSGDSAAANVRATAAPEPARLEPAPSATPSLPQLSPRVAALTLITPNEEPPAPTPEQKLNTAIAQGAARKLDRPPDPVLHPGPHGGYVYQGHGFEAVIEPNGNVQMSDRYGSVYLPLVPYRTPDGKWHVPLGFGGSFRLFEWLDRKFGKNDPYASERRWFLERTRALRERLAREFAPPMRVQP